MDNTMPAKPQKSSWVFGSRSRQMLEGVHPDLVTLAQKALEHSAVDFGVHCGARTMERQKHLLATGKSSTLKSRHIPMPRMAGGNGFAHAIDIHVVENGEAVWDWPALTKVYEAFVVASKMTGIPFEWGGNWKSFPDGPHFQLPWAEYPPEKQT